jgi:tRNA(His) 5'-end guanylyltransferase
MTMAFNRGMRLADRTGNALFDARAFNIPRSEVANYFLWRAQDWHRNSVSMFAQAHFSHKELHKRNISDMHDMLHDIGKNWTLDLSGAERNGVFLYSNGTEIVDNSTMPPAYRNIEVLWDMVRPREKE